MKRSVTLLLLFAMLLGMLVMPVSAKTAAETTDLAGACPCGCGAALETVEWKKWNINEDADVTSGHYYLDGDYIQTQQAVITSGNRVVLDLRGYELTNKEFRTVLCYGYMALMDSVGGGRLCGNTSGSGYGGVLMITTNETLNSVFELYSGTITLDVNHKGSRRGGLISVGETCTFRMYGGTVQGGTTYSKHADYVDTKDDGGGIYVAAGASAEILGGRIIGCKADRYGGAIYSAGTTVLKNCEIIGGYAENAGGNICQNGGSLVVENAIIRDGVAEGTDYGGGNIAVLSGAKLKIGDSVIRNGYSAYHGGNIYLGNSCSAVLARAVIESGVAANRGNNFYGATSAVGLTIRDCQFPGDITYVGVNCVLEGVVQIGLLNDGLRLWYKNYYRSVNASGLAEGSEIYVDANGTFTDAGAKPDYFKGAVRTVLSESAEGLIATQAASGELGGYCPHCGQRVAWKAFDKTTCLLETCLGDGDNDTDPTCTGKHIATGHYYLTASDASFSQHYVGAVHKDAELDANVTTASDDVVLDLAGYALTSSGRGFYVREGGEGFDPSSMTLMDSWGAGKISGKGTANQGGGVLYGETEVPITVYGGNYEYVAGRTVRNGGVVYSGGPLTVHGGVFDGSTYVNEAYNGGAIYVANTRSVTISAGRFVGGTAKEGGTLYCGYDSTITVTGGQFADGIATTGGNIRVVGTSSYNAGVLNVSGVALTEGHSKTNGGNFCATYYRTYNLKDSYLAEGTSDDYGGNIATATNSTFANYEDLIIYKGSAVRGANIYSAGTGARANFINCYVLDGSASSYGGNFYGGNGYLVIKGGIYDHGCAATYGGNICANAGKVNAGNYMKIEKDSQGNVPLIVGGVAGTYGGNLHINGVLELTDAVVHNGKAKADQGRDIWYLAATADHKAHKFTVGAGVTGNIIMGSATDNLTSPYYANPVKDTVCAALNANIILENLENDPMLTAKDGVLYVGSVAVIDDKGEARWCATVSDAIASCEANEYVKIHADETAVLTKDCAVDLNGYTLNVSGDYTLMGMDSATHNGEESQGKAVLAEGTEYAADHKALNGKRYLAVAEEGGVSFHCLDMRITSVSLRPGVAGLYYNAKWEMDSVLASRIESYGIAVSLRGMPAEDFAESGASLYTRNDAESFVSGKEKASAMIANILKVDASFAQNGNTYMGTEANDLRGQQKIYATPYVAMQDGGKIVYLVGDDPANAADDKAYSLRDILSELAVLVDRDPENFRRYTPALRSFYSAWKDNGLKSWGLGDRYAFGTPAEDDVIDILMIGNSYCYYYVEELYAMAEAAGVKMRVCNLYYSGCPMNNHLNWWRTGQKKYQYFETTGPTAKKTDGVSLEWGLKQHQWDVISFQLGSSEMRKYTVEGSLDQNREARNVMYDYVRQQFPEAELYFHQTWAFEIGHKKDDGYEMKDLTQQIAYTEQVRQIATGICEENGVKRINTGDAWEIYRSACDAAGIAHNLTARLGKDTLTGEPHSGDGSHDGDIGGAQFLNAAVWFEILTGKDVRENTYVPTYTYDGQTYTLSDTMLEMLRDAAHKAVNEVLPTYPENG